MQLRSIACLLAVAVMAVACASPAAPSAAPSVAPSGAPSAAPSGAPSGAPSQAPGSAAAITLRLAPADLGCDTMAVEYRRVTFEIDPGAEEQVTARTDTGQSLRTFWSAGFEASAEEAAVKDPSGQVVAADGETLDIPEGAFPRLHGYFVCPSTNGVTK